MDLSLDSLDADRERAIRTIHDFLAETDPLDADPYDAVIGFGMFDLSLPRFSGDLYARGHVRRIVFTGGVGAGTGNLGGPEADVWRDELCRSHPSISDADVITENRSTNTGENVRFTAALLERDHPGLALERGIKRVIVVASPSRLRRVWLTLGKLHPALDITRRLPDTTLERERALYRAQGIDYAAHVAGEIDRLGAYAERGWILAEPLPDRVRSARAAL